MYETNLTIVGNLTGDPELRYTDKGVAMCRFTVAATPRSFDKRTDKFIDGDPLFMACTAWRELAENVAESLTKGARVVVTGRLRLSRWETPDGEKRSMLQLDADECGPSLRWATATVAKLSRRQTETGGPVDDAWSTASTTRPDSGEPRDFPQAA